MPDGSEKIILSISFPDISGNVEQIIAARAAIDVLIAANQKLEAQGMKNSKAYNDNATTIKTLNTEIQTNSRVVQANTQAVKGNADSIEDLKAQNKQLLKDRNLISAATEEGRKKISELNAKYDENSKVIAANSTQVEKQRFNIGNYQSALDGVVPGLGKFAAGLDGAATGQKGLTLASKAFIATGIGAIIAAVGLALFAVTKYFQGSEEGQNKLNKVTAIAAAIWEQFLNVVEAVGGAIVQAVESPGKAISAFGDLVKENITNRFEGMLELIPAIGKAIDLLFEGEFTQAGQVAFDAVAKVTTGIEDASSKIIGLITDTVALVNAGIANGEKLANLQAKIDTDERKLVEDRAKTNLQVSKLRAAAVELEGNAKRKAVKEAIALEEQLSAREVALAKTRAELAALNVEANGNDKDALNELASARAAVSSAEETAFSNTLKFRKELKSLDEEDAKKAADNQKLKDDLAKKAEEDRLKLLEEQKKNEAKAAADAIADKEAALAEDLERYTNYVQGLINAKKEELLQGKISQEQYNEEIANLQIAADATRLTIKEEFGVEDLALEGKITDAKIILKQKEADETERLEKFKVDAVKNTIGQVAGLFNKNSIAFKALASAQTLIQTFQSAQAVFTGMSETIPGPVGIALGIAGATAAIISGLQNVAKINAVQLPKLEQGGMIEIGGRRHAQGGEKVSIGNRQVAEVEGGETMVVLKRGSSGLLRNLSNINKMSGGVDFYNDRAPRRMLADGGFVARSNQVSSFQNLSIAEDLKKVKIFTSITDLNRVQGQVNKANFTSELS